MEPRDPYSIAIHIIFGQLLQLNFTWGMHLLFLNGQKCRAPSEPLPPRSNHLKNPSACLDLFAQQKTSDSRGSCLLCHQMGGVKTKLDRRHFITSTCSMKSLQLKDKKEARWLLLPVLLVAPLHLDPAPTSGKAAQSNTGTPDTESPQSTSTSKSEIYHNCK